MKHVDIKHVVVFAALVVGSSANAATYDDTAIQHERPSSSGSPHRS
jgi:hypothetical protein